MIARRTHYISYSKDKHSSIHSCTIYNCGYKEIKKQLCSTMLVYLCMYTQLVVISEAMTLLYM